MLFSSNLSHHHYLYKVTRMLNFDHVFGVINFVQWIEHSSCLENFII